MDDPPPATYDLRGRCHCGRLSVRVSAVLLREPVAFTCNACGYTLAFIPPE